MDQKDKGHVAVRLVHAFSSPVYMSQALKSGCEKVE